MALGQYSLSTLAQIKSHLGITVLTDDTVLENCINFATAKIERWIGRQILVRNYFEWYGGNNVKAVRLKQYPINHISGVYSGWAAGLTISSTVPSDISLTISINTDPLGTVANGVLSPCAVLTRTTSAGTTIISTLTFLLYPTTTLLAAAISAITGYSASVTTEMRCAQLHPRAGGDVKQSSVVLTGTNISSEYAYESLTGIVTIRQEAYPTMHMRNPSFASSPLSTLIEYSAGYTTVPDDINYACMVVASTMYWSRKKDTSVNNESLGDYSYSVSSLDASQMLESLIGSWKEIR